MSASFDLQKRLRYDTLLLLTLQKEPRPTFPWPSHPAAAEELDGVWALLKVHSARGLIKLPSASILLLSVGDSSKLSSIFFPTLLQVSSIETFTFSHKK